MIRTVYFAVFIGLTLLLSFVLLVPYIIFWIPSLRKTRMAYLQKAASIWSRLMLVVASGSKVTVKGLENLPESNVLLVSNHQSQLDILTVLGYVPKHVGFIAKIELTMLPVINLWMLFLHCVFIDRKNMKKSARAIDKGVQNLKKGYSMLIFPEGTRSKSHTIGNFKPGALKLGTRSGVPIVPLTIDGTYHIFEESYRIRPANINLTVHPPIYPDKLTEEEKDNLSETIKKQIMTAL